MNLMLVFGRLLTLTAALMAMTVVTAPASFAIQLQKPDGGAPRTEFTLAEPGKRCEDIDINSDGAKEDVANAIGVTLEELLRLKTDRNLDISDICDIPTNKLARAISRIRNPKPDHPGEWAKLRAMQQASEDGLVKPDGLIKAIQQRQRLLAQQAQMQADGGALPDAGVTSGAWTAIGPGNIGGRIRSIVIHPITTTTMWAGGVSGGIWKTVDGGSSWSAVNDFMGNLAVSTMAIDPANNNIMYAGTGEGFFNTDAIRGNGIFKSTDGGTTWNHLTATTPSSAISDNNYDWYHVNRLAITNHTTNGVVILAAARGYYGNTGGVWRSANGGTTWTKTLSCWSYDVKFDPNNANKAVAHCATYNSTTSAYESHIKYSVDNGQTWLDAGYFSGHRRFEIAYAPATPNLVYISYDHASSGSGEIYKSTDGGVNWTWVSTPGHLNGQGNYDNVIWVAPNNSNLIVVGGIDLWRSTDGGVNFTKISAWQYSPTSAHADHHAVVSHPGYNGTTNTTVFFGNDGGVYKATDVTTVGSGAQNTGGWTSLNNGLGVTQFYGGAGNVNNGMTNIIGGTQDNGHLHYGGSGTNWSTGNGGDGGFAALDPAANVKYGEYVYLNLYRSTNNGAYSEICGGIPEANSTYCGGTDNALFIAPFILDPNNADTMYAGAASLWRSNNVKTAVTPTWVNVKASIGASKHISAIAVAEGNPGIVWVGYNSGEVYKTTTGTSLSPTWTQMGSGTLPARYVHRFLIDKDNPSIVYAAFGGYNADNLWKTTDGGTTWADVSGNIPSAPIRTIARNPSNANWLYVGTEVGIYTSENGGSTWSVSNDGPANVSVDELFWYSSTRLVAATHGRGMFYADINSSSATGSLTVTITPTGAVSAGAQWSVDGGAWQASGVTVTGLTAGSHTVSFNTVTGYTSPSNQNVTITAGQTATATGTYVAQTAQSGSLIVTLSPAGAVSAGAQWRVDGGAWQASGVTVTGLTAGSHTVSFNTVTGYTSPANQNVTITAGQTATATGTYVAQTAQNGSLIVTLSPAGAVSAGAQWRVDGGAWQTSATTLSGLSVGSHVVSFSAVTGWATPTNKSVYILNGQTTGSTGTYTPITGSLTVTLSPSTAVTAGAQWQVDSGAWQTSGATVNNLTPGAHMVSFSAVTGYSSPVNQTVTIIVGQTATATGTYRQHASLTVNILPVEAVTGGAQWRVDGGAWQASGATITTLVAGNPTVSFSSVAGYTTPTSQVVAITGGGTTTATGTYTAITASTGSLAVTMSPPDAVTAGTQWRVDGGAWQASGATVTGLTAGNHVVSYSAVTGYTSPANRSVAIALGQTAVATGTYVLAVGSGSLKVNISPLGAVNAGAQWSVDGGAWKASGATVTGLTAGSHTVSFNAVADYTSPEDRVVRITNGGTAVTVGSYKQNGSLKVTISPTLAVTNGAQWSVDGGTTWNNSPATVSGLTAGKQTVTFKTTAVTDYSPPANKTVTITPGRIATATGTYTAGYTVTAKATTGGTVTPAKKVVTGGSTVTITVTPRAGYTTSPTVGGTCVAGSLNGAMYTTGAVTEACLASITFTKAPTVTTGSALKITQTETTLNGKVNPENDTTTVTFEYVDDTTYLASVYASPSTVSAAVLTGGTAQSVAAPITALMCGTKYHFRVVGSNTDPLSPKYGLDRTFTTKTCGDLAAD